MKNERMKLILAGILAAVAIAFLNYMFYAKPLMYKNSRMRTEIERVKQQKRKILLLLKNFERMKRERDALKDRIENLKSLLPKSEDLPGLIRSIAQLAHYSGVDLNRVELGREVVYPEKNYAAINIKISFSSTYGQLVTFLERVDNLNRLVRPYRLSVVSSGVSADPSLKINGMLQTYRYVEVKKKGRKRKRR